MRRRVGRFGFGFGIQQQRRIRIPKPFCFFVPVPVLCDSQYGDVATRLGGAYLSTLVAAMARVVHMARTFSRWIRTVLFTSPLSSYLRYDVYTNQLPATLNPSWEGIDHLLRCGDTVRATRCSARV